jgi:hypothetical protein
MDAPERGALMLVRFIAAALIGWAMVEVLLYVAVCRHKNLPVAIFPCAAKSIPLFAGLIMLMKAKSIAAWISEKLDL